MQIETKFDIGDEVFFIHDKKIRGGKVVQHNIKVDKDVVDTRTMIRINGGGHETMNDFNLFKTKKDLLDSL